METTPATQSQGVGEAPSDKFAALLADAIRFWEPRRIAYNVVLGVVVVIWLVATWPHFRPALTLQSLLLLGILALLGNLCYCAAYLLEIPVQRVIPSAMRKRVRWAVWLAGTLLAILLANYWIVDEIYPFVR